MANDSEWKEWVEFHSSLFGMDSKADAKLFRAWRGLLCGYALEELRSATVEMAENAEKSRADRAAHYAYVKEIIKAKRSRAQAYEKAPISECGVCGGSGYLDLPHWVSIKDGEWGGKYTLMVCCDCSAGWERKRKEQKMMSLGEYEVKNPGWKEQLAKKAASRPKPTTFNQATNFGHMPKDVARDLTKTIKDEEPPF